EYHHYDDYSYCTKYYAYKKINNENTFLGCVKIGCLNLSEKVESGVSNNGFASYSIDQIMPTDEFNNLENDYFSLGQSIDYYKNINDIFGNDADEYYKSLNDLAYSIDKFKSLYNDKEPCLVYSLLRELHYTNVIQFNRISHGECENTRYDFDIYYKDEKLPIIVDPDENPPSNIHVLIGRNGVGKTFLLYNIVCHLLENMELIIDKNSSHKYKYSEAFKVDAERNSFAGVIGVSFSAFDDGLSSIQVKSESESLLENQHMKDDFKKKYKYIGLLKRNTNRHDIDDTRESNNEESDFEKEKNKEIQFITKSANEMCAEFVNSLKRIKTDRVKRETFIETCDQLKTDSMFSDNEFIKLLNNYLTQGNKVEEYIDRIERFFYMLSSGHMVIILSLTCLCEAIYEKTIVIIDEPEIHLHPPLLSTYIRSLSFMLRKKNAVAILATHSPIVLQEVPSCCVTKVIRKDDNMSFIRIENETFASGTDLITREIFGYDILKTGFYKLIEDNLKEDFEATMKYFNDRVGSLGQMLMLDLLSEQENENDQT
ncbi:hypothetical protein RASY3_09210, partial [Ruminococcus albus SY3]